MCGAVVNPAPSWPILSIIVGGFGAAQDSASLRAMGLAYHWQRLLDEQRAMTLAEIAEAEGIDVTQVRRLMRLTLLASEDVERLFGAPEVVLEQVMRRPIPSNWADQLRVPVPPA